MGLTTKIAAIAFALAAVTSAAPQVVQAPPASGGRLPTSRQVSMAVPSSSSALAPFPSMASPIGTPGLNATKTHAPATQLATATNVPTDEVVPCRAPYGQQNGCSFCNNTMGVKPGKIDSAPFNPFNDTAYGSSTGMAGYNVWFSIPQPSNQCKTLIIIPTHDAEPAFGSVGVTIVSAEQAGCYGATLQSNGYAVASCCGDDECNTVGAGQLAKRNVPRSPYQEMPKQKKDVKEVEEASLSKRFVTFAGTGVSSPDAPPAAPSPSGSVCQQAVLSGGGNITRAGAQQVNETQYYCNGVGGEPCSLAWGLIVSSSQSASVSNSTGTSDGTSGSVAVSAGWFDIEGPTASVTTSVGWDHSDSTQKSLGMDTSHGTETTLTFTMSQAPNTYAMLSFVPYLNCQNYTMNCTDGQHSVEWCQPGEPNAGYPLLMYTG